MGRYGMCGAVCFLTELLQWIFSHWEDAFWIFCPLQTWEPRIKTEKMVWAFLQISVIPTKREKVTDWSGSPGCLQNSAQMTADLSSASFLALQGKYPPASSFEVPESKSSESISFLGTLRVTNHCTDYAEGLNSQGKM